MNDKILKKEFKKKKENNKVKTTTTTKTTTNKQTNKKQKKTKQNGGINIGFPRRLSIKEFSVWFTFENVCNSQASKSQRRLNSMVSRRRDVTDFQ